jgi:hypothetical protein
VHTATAQRVAATISRLSEEVAPLREIAPEFAAALRRVVDLTSAGALAVGSGAGGWPSPRRRAARGTRGCKNFPRYCSLTLWPFALAVLSSWRRLRLWWTVTGGSSSR